MNLLKENKELLFSTKWKPAAVTTTVPGLHSLLLYGKQQFKSFMTLVLDFNIFLTSALWYWPLIFFVTLQRRLIKSENHFTAPNKNSAKYYECMKFADHKLHSVIFQSFGELANYMPPIPHA